MIWNILFVTQVQFRYLISSFSGALRSIPYINRPLLAHWNINSTEDQSITHLSLQTINISICLEAKDKFPLCLINRLITTSAMNEDKAISSTFISNHIIWLDLTWVREFYHLTTHNTKKVFPFIDSQFLHH